MAEDAELEHMRAKRQAQLSQQQQQQAAQQQEQLRSALAQLLEPDAYSRLMLVKAASSERFMQAVQAITYLRQSGRMKGRLSDAQLKAILSQFAAREPKGSITFKRKGGDE